MESVRVPMKPNSAQAQSKNTRRSAQANLPREYLLLKRLSNGACMVLSTRGRIFLAAYPKPSYHTVAFYDTQDLRLIALGGWVLVRGCWTHPLFTPDEA